MKSADISADFVVKDSNGFADYQKHMYKNPEDFNAWRTNLFKDWFPEVAEKKRNK